MPRTKAQIKGDGLERAVQLLETVILGTNPATKDATIAIEPKRIVSIKDVKHEIDIYITIDYGRGYKATFIFECKNWEKKVDKNEIIVFSYKVAGVCAQTGYFVAKSFTKDAKEQVEQDDRLKLLIATDDLGTSMSLITDFSISINTDVNSHTTFFFHPRGTSKLDTLTDESFAVYKDEHLLLRALNERLRQKLIDETMRSVPADAFVEDASFYKRTQSLVFQPQELIVEGQEIYQADMTVTWKTRVIHPPIVSKFDIKTRGRVITYDSGEIPLVGSIQMSFVEIE